MARRRSERMIVTRVSGSGDERRVGRRPDELIVEEPMSIQLDGTLVSTTMRTPGHDYELAVGFCLTEGLLAEHPVVGVRYCADGSAVDSEFNVVTVETGGRAPAPTPRLGNVSSSCGWCGSEQLDDLCARLDPLPGAGSVDLDVIGGIADRVGGQPRPTRAELIQGLLDRGMGNHRIAAVAEKVNGCGRGLQFSA